MKNELDDFFEGVPGHEDPTQVFEPVSAPATPEQGGNKSESFPPEQEEEPRKNRTHRRWEQRLDEKERDLIAREARIETLTEMSKFNSETQDVDSRFLRIYGDSPETREAWKLQQDMFNEVKTKAKEEALSEIVESQRQSAREQKELESFIDSQLEAIEDEYNVDLTSNTREAHRVRTEFLGMIEKASPKNADGDIADYADFGSVWEFYQSKQSKDKVSTDRQREISSRSMSKSNSGSTTTEQTITPGFNGWKKDYGLI